MEKGYFFNSLTKSSSLLLRKNVRCNSVINDGLLGHDVYCHTWPSGACKSLLCNKLRNGIFSVTRLISEKLKVLPDIHVICFGVGGLSSQSFYLQ